MENERIFEIELTEEELKIVGIALQPSTMLTEKIIYAFGPKGLADHLELADRLCEKIREIIENSTH